MKSVKSVKSAINHYLLFVKTVPDVAQCDSMMHTHMVQPGKNVQYVQKETPYL